MNSHNKVTIGNEYLISMIPHNPENSNLNFQLQVHYIYTLFFLCPLDLCFMFDYTQFIYPLNSTSMENQSIKGTVQRDFRPPVFSSFEPALASDQWVKIFSILVKNSQSYSKFKLQKSDSLWYHTPASQSPRGIIPTASQSPRGMMPRKVTFFTLNF